MALSNAERQAGWWQRRKNVLQALPRDNADLSAESAVKDQQNARLSTALAAKDNEIAQLKARIAELKRLARRQRQEARLGSRDPSLA